MPPQFFPNLAFGWGFLVCLAMIMATASFTDLRLLVIPKELSLAGLALGILFNFARGTWLGYLGLRTWCFSEPNAFLGALDGLLFAFAGFAFGFALFFLLWILGIAGGGDVKLFAALGAWIGPRWSLYVLAGTLGILIVIIVAQAMVAVFSGNLKVKKVKPNAPVKRRLITFALPLSIATGIVLAWVLRKELHLEAPNPVAVLAQGDSNVYYS